MPRSFRLCNTGCRRGRCCSRLAGVERRSIPDILTVSSRPAHRKNVGKRVERATRRRLAFFAGSLYDFLQGRRPGHCWPDWLSAGANCNREVCFLARIASQTFRGSPVHRSYGFGAAPDLPTTEVRVVCPCLWLFEPCVCTPRAPPPDHRGPHFPAGFPGGALLCMLRSGNFFHRGVIARANRTRRLEEDRRIGPPSVLSIEWI